MELCRQWFIYGKTNTEPSEKVDINDKNQIFYDPSQKYGSEILGGMNNGYTEKALSDFWSLTEGYSDYLFNKSHAACYSYITILTAWLKTYYPVEFMSALLGVQTEQEKINTYIETARAMNIPIKAPDINKSGVFFKSVNGEILFGLGSIKGIGAKSLPVIIQERPYIDLEDAIARLPKKFFNKTVGEALIKSGAFDFENINRHESLNTFHKIRKDKNIEELDPLKYDENICIAFEQEYLSASVTHIPWWETILVGETVDTEFELIEVNERQDKKGNLMGFITCKKNNSLIKVIVFSKTYRQHIAKFDMTRTNKIRLKGKKDDKGTLIVSSVKPLIVTTKEANNIMSIMTLAM